MFAGDGQPISLGGGDLEAPRRGWQGGVMDVAVAEGALGAYPGFGDAAVEAVAASFNTVFRVEPVVGAAAALRVGPVERIHPAGTELIEARWMRALRADAGVPTPQVHDTAAGQPFVPGPRICMLFEWVPGVALGEVMDPSRAGRMGALLARIHDHAAGWPPDPAPLTADRVLYWQIEDRLDEVRSVDPIVGEAFARASAAVAELWADPPHRPHLLHGDFTPDNVMVHDDVLVPIDFQDLVVGFDIQDLAMALVSLGRFDDADDLRRRFRVGYETVRPWPGPDRPLLDTLIAARRLHQLNLALTLRRPGLDHFIARARQLLGEWMAP